MSGTVDSRIVSMKFDNLAFNKAAALTMGVLDKLKTSISGIGTGPNGFGKLQASANATNLAPVQTQVSGISAKFLALGTIGVTALTRITDKAIAVGTQLASSLTIDPLKTGFAEYEKGLNSVQTILANTQASGATLEDVNATLLELNHYADQTIYNFGEMTRNIGTFTAAGVDLETATASIKGISNLAALSGSNSQQASTAMYQLSQAISAGKVGLMDWNSVVNAGMGGAVFQRALAQTGVAMGTINKDALALEGKMKNVKIEGQSFRNSIMAKPGSESWLTSEVLTTTLKQFTGDMKDAELAAIGFNKEQIRAIQTQATTAFEAATKIKTLTQLIDTSKEIAGSGWAQTWQFVFGDFTQARRSFSKAGVNILGLIEHSAKARNEIMYDWKLLGGRKQLIKSIMNIWEALGSVLGPVRDAFRDVFPPATGKTLLALTAGFREFTRWLVVSEETGHAIRQVFRSVFTVLKLVLAIVGGVIYYFADLAALAIDLAAPFFRLAAAIIDIVYQLGEFSSAGDGISGLFQLLIDGRRAVLEPIIGAITAIVDAFTALITGGPQAFAKALGHIPGAIGGAFDAVKNAIFGVFDGIGTFLGNLLDKLGPLGAIVKGFGQGIVDAFQGAGQVVKTFVDSAIGPLIDKFQNIFGGIKGPDVGGVFGQFKSALQPVVDFFQKDFISGINDAFAKLIPYAVTAGEFVGKAFESLLELVTALIPYLVIAGRYLGIAFDTAVVAIGIFWDILKATSVSVINFFKTIDVNGQILKDIWAILQDIGNGIKDFFGGLDLGFSGGTAALQKSEGVMQRIKDVLMTIASGIGDAVSDIGGVFGAIANAVVQGVKYAALAIAAIFYGLYLAISAGFGLFGGGGQAGEIWGRIEPILGEIVERIKGFFERLTFQDVLALVNTGFFIAFYRAAKGFFDSVKPMIDSFKGVGDAAAGAFGSLGGTFDQATDNLKAMQLDLKAGALLKIAGAILVLAVALWLLSKIPAKQLATGTAVIAALLFTLQKFISAIEATAASGKASLNITAIAIGIGALGLALLLLAIAIKIFGKMNPDDLQQGMISIGIILVGLTAMINKISGSGASMVAAAIGIGILALALMLFAGAIKVYAMIDVNTLAKGIITIAIIMQILTNTLGKMGPGMVQAAIGVGILALALIVMSVALKKFSKFTGEEMVKSIVMLAATLGILYLAMMGMNALGPAAKALALVSASLLLLAMAMKMLGSMSLKEIGFALLALVGVFIVLGLAAFILAPLVPVIWLMGKALLMLGLGMLAAGAGMVLFALGLGILAVSGVAGFAVLTAGIIGLLSLIPLIAEQIGLGIVAIAKVLSESGPVLFEAFRTMLSALLQAATELIPDLEKLITELIRAVIDIVANAAEDMGAAALRLIEAIMTQIRDNAPVLARRAREMAVALIESFAEEFPILVDRAFRALIRFMNDLADTINDNAEDVGRAGGRLAVAIVNGFITGIGGFTDEILQAVQDALPSPAEVLGNFRDAIVGGLSRMSFPMPDVDLPDIGGETGVILTDEELLELLEESKGAPRTKADSVFGRQANRIAARLSNRLASSIDTTITITPVLDLTEIRSGASEISEILNGAGLRTATGYSRANLVAADLAARQAALAENDGTPGDTTVFNQYNTSPKPLDPIEVHRNTKSGLALLSRKG